MVSHRRRFWGSIGGNARFGLVRPCANRAPMTTGRAEPDARPWRCEPRLPSPAGTGSGCRNRESSATATTRSSTSHAYRAEWARLRAQREELVSRTAERTFPSLPLGSLMEGWARGDPRTRRGLLAAFFDEIDIVDQEIVSVVPRNDYAAEVVALLDKLDEQYCRCSPGGIRRYSHNTLWVPAV